MGPPMQPPGSNGEHHVLRPPISTGHHHVLDGALWRNVAIKEKSKMPWPFWGRGIVDLRPIGRPMVAGRLLRHAINEAKRIVRQTPCQHKVGMCKCSYERFMMYQHDEAEWQPWVLCMLATTTTREGAFFLEASLILEFEKWTQNHQNNINWIRSCDYGGEGPNPPADAHAEHVVYLAVRPITPSVWNSSAAGKNAKAPIPLETTRWTADSNAQIAEPPAIGCSTRLCPLGCSNRDYCPNGCSEGDYCPVCGNRDNCLCDEEEIEEAMRKRRW
jgi:hypothetical protein